MAALEATDQPVDEFGFFIPLDNVCEALGDIADKVEREGLDGAAAVRLIREVTTRARERAVNAQFEIIVQRAAIHES